MEEQLREGEGTVVDRIDRWLSDEGRRLRPDKEIATLRFRAILANPQLRARELQVLEPIRTAIAQAVARDFEVLEGSMGPQVFATAVMGFLSRLARH